MTAILAILALAVLVALFGLLMRGRRLTCGGDGACGAGSGGCAACGAAPEPVESRDAHS